MVAVKKSRNLFIIYKKTSQKVQIQWFLFSSSNFPFLSDLCTKHGWVILHLLLFIAWSNIVFDVHTV